MRTVQDHRLVAIELGAGTTIATVRRECEYVAWRLIRINPHDTEPPARGVLLPVGALEALTALETGRESSESHSHPWPSTLTP